MAKRRSNARGQRAVRNTPTNRSPRGTRLDPVSSYWYETYPASRYQFRIRSLPAVQDDRLYSPTPTRPYRTLSGRKALLRAVPARVTPKTPYKAIGEVPRYVGFDVPRETLVCVRRKQRREVIFAMGAQGGGHRRPRRNESSDLRC